MCLPFDKPFGSVGLGSGLKFVFVTHGQEVTVILEQEILKKHKKQACVAQIQNLFRNQNVFFVLTNVFMRVEIVSLPIISTNLRSVCLIVQNFQKRYNTL